MTTEFFVLFVCVCEIAKALAICLSVRKAYLIAILQKPFDLQTTDMNESHMDNNSVSN